MLVQTVCSVNGVAGYMFNRTLLSS